jgi:hypothetical protein
MAENATLPREVFMTRALVVGIGLVALVTSSSLLPAQVLSQTDELIIGTWKQNVARSTYNPGGPPPNVAYAVRQYAAGTDGSIVAITMNVDPRGLPSLGAISAANYDGKEYAQHTVATLATSLSSHIGPRMDRTISYKRVDPYTVRIVQKQGDAVIAVSTRTISRDGKTMTDASDYTDTAGRHVTNVLVFEKQ